MMMMTSRKHFLIITLVCLLSLPSLTGQTFKLTLQVPDTPSTDLILAHRFGLKFYTDDTVRTQVDGTGVFMADSLLPQGMYQIVFPDKQYIEFFLGDVQVFEISTLGSAPRQNLIFKGSPENTTFSRWQTTINANRTKSSLLQQTLKAGGLDGDSIQNINQELRALNLSTNQTWDLTLKELGQTGAGKFVRGMKPIRMPDSLASDRSQQGQMKQYQYVRSHFFDGVDFSDIRMLRTPLIETKLDQYFNQIVPPYPDTIMKDARYIIDRARSNPEVFHFVLQYLFNLYSEPKIMGTDAVYVFLAEEYYLKGEAPWVDSLNLKGILSRVTELKPLLLGQPAPVIQGLVNSDDKPVDVRSISSEYLVLFFYDPGCGHCKEVAPALYTEYSALKALGCEVVAINTHPDKAPWLQFIADLHLDWINLFSPTMSRQLMDQYQVYSTPRIFLLGPGNLIVGKDLPVEQIRPFVEQLKNLRPGQH